MLIYLNFNVLVNMFEVMSKYFNPLAKIFRVCLISDLKLLINLQRKQILVQFVTDCTSIF